MRRFFETIFNNQTKPNRRARRAQKRQQMKSSNVGYDNLEERKLLTVSAGFSGGLLAVGLTEAGDTAAVTVTAGGLVAVNGNTDLNPDAAGAQTATSAAVTGINVSGVEGVNNQSVQLAGSFSNLNTVNVNAVSSLDFVGSYVLGGNLNVVLDGNGGGVVDSGVLVVQGQTSIDANDNPINLDNNNNNFVGAISLSTNFFNSVVIADQNDVVLDNVDVNGDLIVSSGGDVSDVSGSAIDVGRNGIFAAQSVVLGDNAADDVNFLTILANTTGLFELHEDSITVIRGDNQWGSAIIESDVIVDSRTSNINILGDAVFDATLIRLGEHGTDTFNAGRVNFNAPGQVHIHENSSLTVFGDNVANTLNLVAVGDLTDSDDTVLNAAQDVGLQATGDIILGDTDTDVFNSGRLTYFSLSAVQVTENTDIVIFDTQNFAQSVRLEANGEITDVNRAQQLILGNATYVSNGLNSGVNIGDTDIDRFTAGSITFNVQGDGEFRLEEDNATLITGTSNAFNSRIQANGNITNNLETILNVDSNASFIGNSIFLGEQDGDFLTFGSLTLTAPDGSARIFENIDPNEDQEDMNLRFAGDTVVGTLRADSPGDIRDVANGVSINVTGFANLSSDVGITLGEQPFGDDQFNAGSLAFNTPGPVQIFEDSDMFLAGGSEGNGINHTALSTNLFAVGDVNNGAFANIQVQNVLIVASTGDITLGRRVDIDTGEETDFLSSGQLNFRTLNGITDIESDTDIDLTGTNSAIEFSIRSDGDITDGIIASTTADSLAFFAADNITIGDTDMDCFQVTGVEGQVIAVASDPNTGVVEVTEGCP